jgi:hypothetical protein
MFRSPFAAVPLGLLGRLVGCVVVLGVRCRPGSPVLCCVCVCVLVWLRRVPRGRGSLRGAVVCFGVGVLWGVAGGDVMYCPHCTHYYDAARLRFRRTLIGDAMTFDSLHIFHLLAPILWPRVRI